MRRKKKARRGWRKKKRKPALASSIPGFVAGDGESWWKNVGMPPNVECTGGEVGKGVNEERTRERIKEGKKRNFHEE
jgi:hypothetical protein